MKTKTKRTIMADQCNFHEQRMSIYLYCSLILAPALFHTHTHHYLKSALLFFLLLLFNSIQAERLMIFFQYILQCTHTHTHTVRFFFIRSAGRSFIVCVYYIFVLLLYIFLVGNFYYFLLINFRYGRNGFGFLLNETFLNATQQYIKINKTEENTPITVMAPIK